MAKWIITNADENKTYKAINNNKIKTEKFVI